MKKSDNFDAGKWLVENKLTTQSRLSESVITEAREANQFGIESQHIGKLQDGKLSKYTEGHGMPFGLISRPESGLSDTDKNAVKDYVNADNIVLGFYPTEDSNNNTMYNAVKAGGIKIIEDLVSKEYDLELIKTIKGKRHCVGDTCSLMHYLVFSKTNESLNEAFNPFLDTEEGGYMREYIDDVVEDSMGEPESLDLGYRSDFDMAFNLALTKLKEDHPELDFEAIKANKESFF
jgi:hypothetical protein